MKQGNNYTVVPVPGYLVPGVLREYNELQGDDCQWYALSCGQKQRWYIPADDRIMYLVLDGTW